MRGKTKSSKTRYCADEAATRRVGAELALKLSAGDVVMLEGELGAGKTTFVKGALAALGYKGIVRSPTFNLLQVFDTVPPVVHADLYRVPSAVGLGIEDYLDTHIVFVEWAERAEGLASRERVWTVRIEFEGDGRSIAIHPPQPA